MPLNDGGDKYEDEEEDEYDEEYDDQYGDHENEGDGGEAEDADERPKLAEGFYEIESVRKKRSRKVYCFSFVCCIIFIRLLSLYMSTFL